MTKYGKKICIVGESYIKRVKRNIFNNSRANENVQLKYFRGAKVRYLNHFIELTLSEDKLDMLHIGSNDISHRNIEDKYQYDC